MRYLEHGHLRLVFEASRERRILLRTAPQLVRPLAFTWPVYRGARVPRWKLEAGLTLYDALALWRNVGIHRALSPEAVLTAEPALRAAGLTGGARYWDAATDDRRLTLATVLAAREAGAVVLNHIAATGVVFDQQPSACVRLLLCDALDGSTIELRARAVVNATGPWSDAFRRLSAPAHHAAHAAANTRPFVLGAKGVHVAIPADRLAVHGALTLLAPADGRVTFVLPNGRTTLLGTTESSIGGDPQDVRATAGDVAYLLAVANHYLPDARLTPDDVVSAWAGVRPLAAATAGPAAQGTAASSREHAIVSDPRGVVTVTGGKLTTYRSMAAEVVDAVGTLLGVPAPRAPTDRLPLQADPGAAAARLTALTRAHPVLACPVAPGLPYTLAQCVYAVEAEQAVTLADLLVRRLPVAFETRDAGRAAAETVAPLIAPLLGWDPASTRAALASYGRDVARVFAIDR